MLKRAISFAVKVIKGRSFKIDKEVPNRAIFSIVFHRAIDLLRGIILIRKIVFIGSGSKITSRSRMFFGKGVVIGRFTEIDGLSKEGLIFGNAVSIGAHSIIRVSGTLTDIGKGINFGDNVGIGDFSHIGGAGGVSIGNDTIIGAYFSVHPENHNFNDKDILIRKQGVNRKGIKVGNNCWIGAKVTILDGSVIGDGCVVAAGSVVNGTYPNNVVIGGVPSRVLKEI